MRALLFLCWLTSWLTQFVWLILNLQITLYYMLNLGCNLSFKTIAQMLIK